MMTTLRISEHIFQYTMLQKLLLRFAATIWHWLSWSSTVVHSVNGLMAEPFHVLFILFFHQSAVLAVAEF